MKNVLVTIICVAGGLSAAVDVILAPGDPWLIAALAVLFTVVVVASGWLYRLRDERVERSDWWSA